MFILALISGSALKSPLVLDGRIEAGPRPDLDADDVLHRQVSHGQLHGVDDQQIGAPDRQLPEPHAAVRSQLHAPAAVDLDDVHVVRHRRVAVDDQSVLRSTRPIQNDSLTSPISFFHIHFNRSMEPVSRFTLFSLFFYRESIRRKFFISAVRRE